MKIGAMNHPGRPILNEIKSFGEMGLDFVDLTFEEPESTPEKLLKQKKEIFDLLNSYNMFLTGHAVWYLEIGHPYQSMREAALKEGFKIIDTAVGFGLEKISFHGNTPVSGMLMREFRDRIFEFNIDSIKKLTNHADMHGIKLCVENSPPKEILSDIEEFKMLFRDVPKAMFHLDIGHANLLGSDEFDKFLKEFKNRLMHIHLHDNKGKDDDHLPIGAGRIDWVRVIKAIKDSKYDGTIGLEVFSSDTKYIKISKDKLIEIWKRY